MPDVLVRNLDPQTIARLKARADAHGRSLQAELARILEEAGREQERRANFRRWAEEFSRSLEGREHSDSAELLRQDRDTDHGRDV